jgi:translation initiation factor IF-1
MAGDHLQIEGVVLKAQGNGTFLVKSDDGGIDVICTLSGKIRKNTIKIMEGDKVKVNISPYDLSRGFIVYRNK